MIDVNTFDVEQNDIVSKAAKSNVIKQQATAESSAKFSGAIEKGKKGKRDE